MKASDLVIIGVVALIALPTLSRATSGAFVAPRAPNSIPAMQGAATDRRYNELSGIMRSVGSFFNGINSQPVPLSSRLPADVAMTYDWAIDSVGGKDYDWSRSGTPVDPSDSY